jgi:hypothetical protein
VRERGKHFNGESGGIATFRRPILERKCPVLVVKDVGMLEQLLR